MEEVVQEFPVFSDVSRCFVDALRRVLRVAAEDENGELTSLSQTELAERANVARSTLAKYFATRADDPPANPNLDIICRLADALGVPPAMLLMRPQDWASLGSAMLAFTHAAKDASFMELGAGLQALESTAPTSVADAALRIGRRLKTVEDQHDQRVSQEVRSFRRAARASVATTAASIPFRLEGVSTAHLPALLTICGILGPTVARRNQ